MILDKYLVISQSRKGYKQLSAKMVEREPKLAGNEISLRLRLDIPDALFTRPRLDASMKLPDTVVPHTKLTPEITTNVEKIIKEATGLNMVVSIVEQVPEKKSK